MKGNVVEIHNILLGIMLLIYRHVC